MSYGRKFFTILILLMTAVLINAQEKNESKLDAKLKEVKGDVQKIVITADGKQTVLEGKDAADLFEKFRNASKKNLMWITEDGDSMNVGNKNVKFFVSKDGGKALLNKNVKVENKDGDMVVTVESTNGDKNEVIVYTGKDAEKFLEDEKSDGKMNVIVKKLNDKTHKTWVTAESDADKAGNNKEIKKRITVDDKDGQMKVTVETTENGETKTEEYIGDEAKKFLEENKEGKEFHIFTSDGDDDNVFFIREDADKCCDSTGCKQMRVKMHKTGDEDKDAKVIIIKKKEKKDK